MRNRRQGRPTDVRTGRDRDNRPNERVDADYSLSRPGRLFALGGGPVWLRLALRGHRPAGRATGGIAASAIWRNAISIFLGYRCPGGGGGHSIGFRSFSRRWSQIEVRIVRDFSAGVSETMTRAAVYQAIGRLLPQALCTVHFVDHIAPQNGRHKVPLVICQIRESE